MVDIYVHTVEVRKGVLLRLEHVVFFTLDNARFVSTVIVNLILRHRAPVYNSVFSFSIRTHYQLFMERSFVLFYTNKNKGSSLIRHLCRQRSKNSDDIRTLNTYNKSARRLYYI